MLIKVCGITDPAQAKALTALDVDMVGVVMVASSSRCVSLDRAAMIFQQVKNVQKVVVLQNQSLATVRKIITQLRPDYLQLHGQETPAYCAALNMPVIKAIALADTVADSVKNIERYASVCDFVLIDRKTQGQGQLVELSQVAELVRDYSLILSGGLNSEVIVASLTTVGKQLAGVDVNSGVEDAPGHKNLDLVKKFVTTVRSSDV